MDKPSTDEVKEDPPETDLATAKSTHSLAQESPSPRAENREQGEVVASKKFKKKGFTRPTRKDSLKGDNAKKAIYNSSEAAVPSSPGSPLPPLPPLSEEEHEALLTVHRKAIQKVLSDSSEQILESIMDHTSKLQAAALRSTPELTAALSKAVGPHSHHAALAGCGQQLSSHNYLMNASPQDRLGLHHVPLAPKPIGIRASRNSEVGDNRDNNGLMVKFAKGVENAGNAIVEKVQHELHDTRGKQQGKRNSGIVEASPLANQDSANTANTASTFEPSDSSPRKDSPTKAKPDIVDEFEFKGKPKGLFADADDMKEQLRLAVMTPTYDVMSLYKTEGWPQAIAKSVWFEHLTLFIISFNAIWIAVDVDMNDASTVLDAKPIFILADNFFCLYFLWEVSIRFGAFQVKRKAFGDSWFSFDFSMACMMVAETWCLPLALLIIGGGSGDGVDLGDASLLKGVRLVRLVRMARVVRLLNAMPELMVLIKGMRVGFRAVSCTVALMVLVIYVFAVAFRQLTDGTSIGDRTFPTVPKSMRYLLIQGTMPDVFDAIMPIWHDNDFYALIFVLFVLVVTITIMNMLVGVLVGVVNTITTVEKEALLINFVKTSLLELMEGVNADEDDDGHINRQEFEKLIQIPAALQAFSQMGVDVVGLVDLADFIFADHLAAISYGDFIDLLIQLRGTNSATVKDIVDLRKCVTLEMVSTRQHVEKLMDHMEQVFQGNVDKDGDDCVPEEQEDPGMSSGERWQPDRKGKNYASGDLGEDENKKRSPFKMKTKKRSERPQESNIVEPAENITER